MKKTKKNIKKNGLLKAPRRPFSKTNVLDRKNKSESENEIELEIEDFYSFGQKETEKIINEGRLVLKEKNPLPAWSRGGVSAAAFAIPAPLKKDYRWIKSCEEVKIGTVTIKNRFFYFGKSMELIDGSTEPSLVNPDLPFLKGLKKNPHSADFPESPPQILDYAALNLAERAEYLGWLSGDAQENGHDWCAKLYMLGIERRVIEDYRRGVVDKTEAAALRDELLRLIDAHGRKPDGTAEALSLLYQYIALNLTNDDLETLPLPYHAENSAYSVYLGTLLNQYAKNKKPLSAELFFETFAANPSIPKPKKELMSLCYSEFKALFIKIFNEAYNNKIFVKQIEKKMKVRAHYTPSGHLIERAAIKTPFELKQIDLGKYFNKTAEEISEQIVFELSHYAYFLRTRENQDSDKYRLKFAKPFFVWSDKDKKNAYLVLEKIKEAGGFLVYNDKELASCFEKGMTMNDELLFDFTLALEDIGIGIAPDIINTDFRLKKEGPLFLYVFDGKKDVPRWDKGDGCCMEGLAVIAAAFKECIPKNFDICFTGYFDNGKNSDYYLKKIKHEFLYMCLYNPPSLEEALKPLRKTNKNFKEQIVKLVKSFFEFYFYNASFDAGAKGIDFLERIYSAFKLEKSALYSDLHKEALHYKNYENKSFDQRHTKKEGAIDAIAVIDKTRLNRLRKESDDVSNLLSSIFIDDETPPPSPKKERNKKEIDNKKNNPLDLDSEHISFLKSLLSKESWTMEEALRTAEKEGVMLDGAVEIINESSYNHYEEPLIYYDSLLTINMELAKNIFKK